jgi:hypothetical protein
MKLTIEGLDDSKVVIEIQDQVEAINILRKRWPSIDEEDVDFILLNWEFTVGKDNEYHILISEEDSPVRLLIDGIVRTTKDNFLQENSADGVEPLTEEEISSIHTLEIGQTICIGNCEIKRVRNYHNEDKILLVDKDRYISLP